MSNPLWIVEQGDCRDVMRAMTDASVDAVVSDPPYGLAFMGKGWDHAVPGVEFWAEALRVAKPGAHLVAFGGTRTFHRLAVAIEDAGWEIRDTLSWLYGSGFPKSHDVSKGIDKLDAAAKRRERAFAFTAWMRSTGITAQAINAATSTDMGHHLTTHPTQPAVATREMFEAIRPLFPAGTDVPQWVELLIDERVVESDNFRARPVIGEALMADTTKGRLGFNGPAHSPTYRGEKRVVPITTAHTDDAAAWAGWGTALKPAWEPIILARKPMRGTVAANVVAHGTGALNVDGCRIASDDEYSGRQVPQGSMPHPMQWGEHTPGGIVSTGNPAGRWPANVCLDEAAAAMLDEPSRFFYTAKASRREREAGLEGMPVTLSVHGNKWTENDAREGGKPTPRTNHHPTVKPIALMRWICRLVTPPGGLVLDPFTGSGTTGCAAVLEGFRFHGAELDVEYADIARRRITHWAAHADANAQHLLNL